MFSVALTVSQLICIYQTVARPPQRAGRACLLSALKPTHVAVLIPCYHKETGEILKAINAITASDFGNIHLFLSFDGEDPRPLEDFMSHLRKELVTCMWEEIVAPLRKVNLTPDMVECLGHKIAACLEALKILEAKDGMSVKLEYSTITMIIAHFPHGGKRHCQSKTYYKFIQRRYALLRGSGCSKPCTLLSN